MTTTLIKDKLSKLVNSQVPEFIQNDYPTFVAFVQAYYEFLEQDQYPQELLQNIFKYNDIDNTVSSFIEYFKKNYLYNIPESNLADKSILIKNLKSLYSHKGTERSYDLLVRLLFNKDVVFSYPGQQVLIASDGRWNQDVSVFVQVLTGDSDDIINQTVAITSGNLVVNTTFIKRKKEAIIYTDDVESVSTDTFEYFLDDTKNVQVSIGDRIEFEDFIGLVVGTTTSVDVIDGGTGFKIGQTFNLVSGDGRKSVIRIKDVSTGGVITKVELLQFGLQYESIFLASFSPEETEISPNIFLISGNTIYLSDSTNGFIDEGTINKYDYALTGSELAFDPTYCGETLRSFYYDSRVVSDREAVLQVNLGAKAKYPGYFKTNNGFLSDDIYLQDRDFYQPFSYVLRIDEQLKKYKKAVLDVLHPAGTKLFGNYEVYEEKLIDPSADTVVESE